MDNNKSMGQRILHFPLTKIIVGLAVCISTGLIGQAGIRKLLDITSLSEQFKNPIAEFTIALFVLAAYITLYKFYEKRRITELSVNRLGRNLISGILLGAILQSLTIYIIYLNNGFFVVSVNSLVGVLPYFMMVLADSTTGEILFIGIFFRITEEKLGSYLALIIFALIFGVIHLANLNGTLIAALSIAIHAGLLLGAAYIYSRNLWLPIAIHFAWDFTQAGIFGANVSGNIISESLLTAKIEGPALISGGYFGPQGSIQAGLFCLSATIVLMILVINKIKS
jgi:membrane protease YdiL (CAAX protease family)